MRHEIVDLADDADGNEVLDHVEYFRVRHCAKDVAVKAYEASEQFEEPEENRVFKALSRKTGQVLLSEA